jgi:signal transduction histidine kinase
VKLGNRTPEQITSFLLTISPELIRESQALVSAIQEDWSEEEKKLATMINNGALSLARILKTLTLPVGEEGLAMWRHQVRSPLSIILGACGVLLDMGTASTAYCKPPIQRLWEQAAQAAEALNELLHEDNH